MTGCQGRCFSGQSVSEQGIMNLLFLISWRILTELYFWENRRDGRNERGVLFKLWKYSILYLIRLHLCFFFNNLKYMKFSHFYSLLFVGLPLFNANSQDVIWTINVNNPGNLHSDIEKLGVSQFFNMRMCNARKKLICIKKLWTFNLILMWWSWIFEYLKILT